MPGSSRRHVSPGELAPGEQARRRWHRARRTARTSTPGGTATVRDIAPGSVPHRRRGRASLRLWITAHYHIPDVISRVGGYIPQLGVMTYLASHAGDHYGWAAWAGPGRASARGTARSRPVGTWSARWPALRAAHGSASVQALPLGRRQDLEPLVLVALPVAPQRRRRQQPHRVRRVLPQVAAGQAARLAGQPVRPLQAGALHPHRRAHAVAGHEVDRRAAAEEPGRRQHRPQLLDQPLLLREAQPHVHEVGFGLDHARQHPLQLRTGRPRTRTAGSRGRRSAARGRRRAAAPAARAAAVRLRSRHPAGRPTSRPAPAPPTAPRSAPTRSPVRAAACRRAARPTPAGRRRRPAGPRSPGRRGRTDRARPAAGCRRWAWRSGRRCRAPARSRTRWTTSPSVSAANRSPPRATVSGSGNTKTDITSPTPVILVMRT